MGNGWLNPWQKKKVLYKATPWPPRAADMYLSHRELLTSLPTHLTPSTLRSQQLLLPLLKSPVESQMAYYNGPSNTNTNSNLSASEGFDWHPFLVQPSATEGTEDGNLTSEFAPANWLSTLGQPGPAVGPMPTLWAQGKDSCNTSKDKELTCGFPDSVALATQDAYENQTGDYGPSYYPVVNQRSQYDHPGSSSQAGPFTSSTALGTRAMIQIPCSSKDPFSSETLESRLLTIREQFRSATGKAIRADPPPTRSTM